MSCKGFQPVILCIHVERIAHAKGPEQAALRQTASNDHPKPSFASRNIIVGAVMTDWF